jgi:hypothetical protein
LKLTYGWENRREEYIVVDAELNRAFKESQRKSKIIRAGIEASTGQPLLAQLDPDGQRS